MFLKTEDRADRTVMEILRRGDVSVSESMKHLKISAQYPARSGPAVTTHWKQQRAGSGRNDRLM